jgi:predicted dehydrogenase
VIPSLASIGLVENIDIASRSSCKRVSLPMPLTGEVFTDYIEALNRSDADIVYVSGINRQHGKLVEAALNRNFHVIVDKPSVTDKDLLHRLVDLASKKNLCLAESIVYPYHPQIKEVKNIFRSANSKPCRLTTCFLIPDLDPGNFRYRSECDGGALWDMGPYAVSIGKVFFDSDPIEIHAAVTDRGGSRKMVVDTAFSVLMLYRDGQSMVGHFGFGSEYRNTVSLYGKDLLVEMDRVYTIPADMENVLTVRISNKIQEKRIASSDCFSEFFYCVLDAVGSGKFNDFWVTILENMNNVEFLRSAVLTDEHSTRLD